MSVELCGARDGSWTCARGSGHSGDHRAIGRDRDYHWTNQSDLLRERDELREALEAARSWLREYHACHTDAADDGLHGLSEQMDAVLSKVTP